MDVTHFAAALTVISMLPACAGDGGQGVDDWGDIGERPSGSISTQTIPSGPPDAAVDAAAVAAGDVARDSAGASDVPAPPADLVPLPVDLAPPPDLAPLIDLRDAEIDTAPVERCPRAAFLAARGRHDNLLVADFASNTALGSWAAEFGAAQSWDARDASGAPMSGAMAVSNANVVATSAATSLSGTRTCLPISEGAQYDLWTQQMIAAGQPGGTGGLALLYFAAADCTGAPVGADTLPLSGTTTAWTIQCGTATAPGAAHSMAVRLVVAKTLEDPALTVLFDDVVVSPHP
jgi:hypothetical protein